MPVGRPAQARDPDRTEYRCPIQRVNATLGASQRRNDKYLILSLKAPDECKPLPVRGPDRIAVFAGMSGQAERDVRVDALELDVEVILQLTVPRQRDLSTKP
jgi:hypothetical protein